MRTLKVGVIQMFSYFGKIEKNTEKAEKFIRKAHSNGAELMVLPEMFSMGIDFNGMEAGLKHAQKVDGYSLTKFKALAKELNIHIVCPVLTEVEDKIYENIAYLIDDEGNIIGKYAKTHPVGDERKLVRAGSEYPVFETKFGKLGITICYDASFPETSRILALKGAELMVVTAGWRGSHYFKEWWDLSLACRALDNLMYVVACNQCGYTGDGSEMYAGKSQVINPLGEVLNSLGTAEEEILYQTIYLDRVAKDREFNTVLIDRHPEHYGDISSSEKNN